MVGNLYVTQQLSACVIDTYNFTIFCIYYLYSIGCFLDSCDSFCF